MYLNIPLCSRLKLPACQCHRSCGASPRYGRRRSGLVRIIIANEHGPALPRMRGRTKSLAMHVLSGPSTTCTLVHEWCCWVNAEASLPLWDIVPQRKPEHTVFVGCFKKTRLINTKVEICFKITQRRPVLILTCLRTKCLSKSQTKRLLYILKFTIGGLRNSFFLFLTILWGVVFGPGLGPQPGALSLLC